MYIYKIHELFEFPSISQKHEYRKCKTSIQLKKKIVIRKLYTFSLMNLHLPVRLPRG